MKITYRISRTRYRGVESVWVIASTETKFVGELGWNSKSRTIHTLRVVPDMQRQGIATEMYWFARERGFRPLNMRPGRRTTAYTAWRASRGRTHPRGGSPNKRRLLGLKAAEERGYVLVTLPGPRVPKAAVSVRVVHDPRAKHDSRPWRPAHPVYADVRLASTEVTAVHARDVNELRK
jgi:hypothetical protein